MMMHVYVGTPLVRTTIGQDPRSCGDRQRTAEWWRIVCFVSTVLRTHRVGRVGDERERAHTIPCVLDCELTLSR